MLKSLGRRLLSQLGGRDAAVAVPSEVPPESHSAGQLEQALLAAQSGRSEDCERLSLLLLAIDSDEPDDVVAQATRLLGEARPALWRDLDLAARRSRWRPPASAEAVRLRVAAGEAGLLSVVVASFRARGDLAGWLGAEAATTYSMPSGATADRLDDALVRHADTLGPDRTRLLRFHLGLAGRSPPSLG